MRRSFTYAYVYTYAWVVMIAAAIFISFSFTADLKPPKKEFKADTILLRGKTKPVKNSYLKNGLHLALPPLKPAVTSNIKVNVARPDDKLLSDVEVYPNPVTDQFNLKYSISRNSNVTIKIKDVLGNDISTVFSQRVESGDHNLNYPVANKLTRGFYFVRVVAGTESVIKRILVL
ncbi:putative secreted protein (Por secretion system target) [Mucilaginibacter oryzae]|uniref:Putative secreted protein (Por secretion system target) n=1 Tax=Mucilaginibacter oryzae TaxID=468058 RepID=A0A316H9Q6_9SPHI|nr:T9SS type A sorting domain-containing protein [Mucilaginibacter oryzae]PWK77774.1 putative secreted protein (Por secretion system target) [Mucilaginibacter oryzae]